MYYYHYYYHYYYYWRERCFRLVTTRCGAEKKFWVPLMNWTLDLRFSTTEPQRLYGEQSTSFSNSLPSLRLTIFLILLLLSLLLSLLSSSSLLLLLSSFYVRSLVGGKATGCNVSFDLVFMTMFKSLENIALIKTNYSEF